MKKSFKQADGTATTIEGTPEEIREYERIVEGDRAPKEMEKKRVPGVLKGSEQPLTPLRPHMSPIQQPTIWPRWCVRCGFTPCICDIMFSPWPQFHPTIWYSTETSDRITLKGGPAVSSNEVFLRNDSTLPSSLPKPL